MRAIAESGLSLKAAAKCARAALAARAVGQATNETPNLLDNQRMVEAERNIGVCVARLQLQCSLQAFPDLTAEALRESLGHRNFLSIAAESLSMEIPAIGEAGRDRLDLFRPIGSSKKHIAFDVSAILEIGGVEDRRLVGDVIAERPIASPPAMAAPKWP